MRRVVITGMGTVSSSGMDVETLWNNVLEQSHGFHPISEFDTTDFDVKYAAEIQNWDPTDYGLSRRDARRLDKYAQYAMVAAGKAIENAGDFDKNLDPYRIGVLVGSGIGGLSTMQQDHRTYLEKGPSRVPVFFIPMMIANMAGGNIAIAYGYKGENYAPVSACSSGNHAIGEAFRKIKYGTLDAAIAGGAESAITEFALAGFNNMGALSRSTDPDRLSIPFDKERSGFVMGEGAGILVLEEYQHAKDRGAPIYAEIVGYGATDDAYHITSIDPEGKGPAKSMLLAIEEAEISPEDIPYINAHGTATPVNDPCETTAIKLAFGQHAKELAVSSTKSITGHLLGAAGAVEAIICAKALEQGILPPTANYQVPDEECDLDYVTDGPRKQDISYALSNSFGFGGHNASLVLKKYTK